jgi:type I restriction enzyme S subunit
MPSEWNVARLGDVCQINPEKRDASWPYLFINYIDIASVGSGILNERASRTKVIEAPSRAQRIVRPGDTIISTVRPNRRSFLYLSDPDPTTVVSTGFAVLRAGESLDPRYLYYLVTNQGFTDFLVTHEEGSAYPAVNPLVFADAEVPIPTLSEQRAIGRTLGALDDKIDLNHSMNETLVAIEHTLFKSWFVDFDPVQAKTEGRNSGLPTTIDALFPDSFQESELGQIPQGWKVRKLSDLCTTQYGYTASANINSIGPRLLRVTDINKQDWIDWSSVPRCEIPDDVLPSYTLKQGDIVVARMADPGKSAIIDDDESAVFASYLVRLSTDSIALNHYVYGFLKSSLYAEYAAGAMSGSVQANMNAHVIVAAVVVVPPTPQLSASIASATLFDNALQPTCESLILYRSSGTISFQSFSRASCA